MNEDQVQGSVNKVVGHIQDVAGAVIGDAGTQVKGKARAAVGAVQDKAGDVVEDIREWTADRPLSAVLIAAGIAFALGRLTANRD